MTRAVLAILGTMVGLVLLLSFKSHFGASAGGPPLPPLPPSSESSSLPPSSAPAAGSPAVIGPGNRMISGGAAPTRFGPVQVRITIGGGKLTKVTVLRSPTANQADVQIGQYALPQLDREALAAQSANIHSVSGATYTSEGYIASLQSALDKARG